MSSNGHLDARAPAVLVDGLSKRYGDLEAVRGIDFEVSVNETFGFLGPNGAGKTTTISMLCTLVRPTGGRAMVGGHDVVGERDEVRRNIGLVFQDTTLDGYLTAEQNLRLHAELYGMPRETVAPRMQQVMEMVQLWDRRGHLVNTFSGGMKRRLEIARGLLHSPRVLFLDEPTVGLDPQTRSSIWGYITKLKREEEITIFLTTHYMDEAEYCHRIAIMDQGKIVALDTPRGAEGKRRRRPCADPHRRRFRRDRGAAGTFRHRGADGRRRGHLRVPAGEEFVPRLFAELGQPINLGERLAPLTRRCVHVLHRQDDPRRRVLGQRPQPQPGEDVAELMAHRPNAAAPAGTSPEADRRPAQPRRDAHARAQPARGAARDQDRLEAGADPFLARPPADHHLADAAVPVPVRPWHGPPVDRAAGHAWRQHPTFIYPGILCMAVMFTAMFSAASIVWDREFGFLREMMVAPVRRSSLVLGKCLGGATVAASRV